MIKTSITLTDNFTPVISKVTSAVNRSIDAMNQLHNSLRAPLAISGVSDIEAGLNEANRAFNTFGTKFDEMGKQIQNNTKHQDNFNRKLREGQNPANKLLSTIKSIAGAYLTLNGIKMVLNLSDNLTMTTARLKTILREGEDINEVMKKIYDSAQRSRAGLMDTAKAVSNFGIVAGGSFGGTDELIAFVEQLNKKFALSGVTASEISSVLLQLKQGMGAGALRGDELRAVLEGAPGVLTLIADRVGISTGKLKDLASQGKITADLIRDSLLSAIDETNSAFETLPLTFEGAWTRIKNTALMAFKPVFDRLSAMANSPAFKSMLSGIEQGIIVIANLVGELFDIISNVLGFIVDNFSKIGPVLAGVAVAFGVLTTATLLQKAATVLLNKALWSSPLTWVALGIVAVTVVVIQLADEIAKLTDGASSGFAIICGWINVVIQFGINLWHWWVNVSEGVSNAVSALGYNMETAFYNSIHSIIGEFYGLLATALDVVTSIGNALNSLPFISIDVSGIASKANEYAIRSSEAYRAVRDFKDIGSEFMEGYNTHDVFKEGWVNDAFSAGVAFGENLLKPGLLGSGADLNIGEIPDYSTLDDIGSGVSDIAGNTGAIKDTLNILEEDLKYLRDIAEREVINRFTTAEIKVDMGGITNNVASGTDLDGIIDKLTNGVYEAMSKAAEGVHV